MQPISVSTLNHQIKSLLETSFGRVFVEGELSRITYHNSGHIYFSLKDETSTIRCVMFRGNAARLKFRLEEGLKVLVDAALTLYTPRGEYQLNCFSIEPSGQGALFFAFEQLKKRLASLGYFDQARKKPLPKFPKKIAIITSATSAALQDMLRIATKRYPLISIDVYDTLTQGEQAAADIAKKIALADSKGYDAIIVGRGGGSIEDLWCFNEEIVAEAIFAATTPIISAVGHEIDVVISDYVADVRAATPSHAMQLLLPDQNELFVTLDTIHSQLTQAITHKLSTLSQQLIHLQKSFEQHSFEKKLTLYHETITKLKQTFHETVLLKLTRFSNRLEQLQKELEPTISQKLSFKEKELKNLLLSFENNHPKKRTKKGYAQIVFHDKISDLDSLEVGDEFEAQNLAIIIKAKVTDKRKI